MNWNRVLTVFIVIFIGINVVLYAYQGHYEKERYYLSQERMDQLTAFINQHEAKLYTFIPKHYPKNALKIEAPKVNKEEIYGRVLGKQVIRRLNEEGEHITNEVASLDFYSGEKKGMIYYSGGKASYIPDNLTHENVEKQVLQFAKDLYGEDITMEITNWKEDTDVNGNQGYRVELNENYHENIIFQNYIKCLVTQDGIIEALAIRYRPIEYIGQKRNIYPFDEVIYSLFYYLEDQRNGVTSATEEEWTIRDVDIGYYLIDADERNLVYQLDPYYRIIFGNGDVYYINAFTNGIYKP